MIPACRGRQVYYDSQRKTLRPGIYLRLHENRGPRLRKSSSRPKCGIRASIRRIIRRSSAATRFMSWLTANARWALNNHRLLLGAYEDVEQQNEFDLLQIVEDLLV